MSSWYLGHNLLCAMYFNMTSHTHTQGESVGMVLHMVGAVPVKEGTGRIARYELLPLEALGGRPRVDVLCNMSGIFRYGCV